MKKHRIAALVLAGVLACTPAASAASANAISASASLYSLGLMQGAGRNADGTPIYALDAALTREQAVVMMLRAIGAADEAAACREVPPFLDAAQRWSAPYLAYAAGNGLVKGVDAETFAPTAPATRQQFAAMLLRALGYEEGTDFLYADALETASHIGLPTSGSGQISRGEAGEMLFAALDLTLRGTTETLADRLLAQGVLTPDAAQRAGLRSAKVSAESVYLRYAGATALVRIYDREDNLLQHGSGFFLNESGVLATNYHVIENGAAAKIEVVLHDGTVCTVTGVIDYKEDSDVCLLQTDTSGTPYLELDTDPQSAGATVYTIGSPLGLQDSITVGIISDPDNIIEEIHYILNTADISQGSSGGPLLNEAGKVAAIVKGAYVFGNRMYIAVHASYLAALDAEKTPVTIQSVAEKVAAKELAATESHVGSACLNVG